MSNFCRRSSLAVLAVLVLIGLASCETTSMHQPPSGLAKSVQVEGTPGDEKPETSALYLAPY